MSRPSEKAVEAGRRRVGEAHFVGDERARDYAETAIEAAHSRALGLDRSVCLREVVERVRSEEVAYRAARRQGRSVIRGSVADFIEGQFS